LIFASKEHSLLSPIKQSTGTTFLIKTLCLSKPKLPSLCPVITFVNNFPFNLVVMFYFFVKILTICIKTFFICVSPFINTLFYLKNNNVLFKVFLKNYKQLWQPLGLPKLLQFLQILLIFNFIHDYKLENYIKSFLLFTYTLLCVLRIAK
jgi:hypothetical protein